MCHAPFYLPFPSPPPPSPSLSPSSFSFPPSPPPLPLPLDSSLLLTSEGFNCTGEEYTLQSCGGFPLLPGNCTSGRGLAIHCTGEGRGVRGESGGGEGVRGGRRGEEREEGRVREGRGEGGERVTSS